jgi:hypothetical protein
METPDIYALLLVVRVAWGIFTLRHTLKLTRGWSRLRMQIVGAEACFIPACLLVAASLHWRVFAPWMTAPLGVCFLLLLPLPCYFEAVNRIRWLHLARNVFFVLLAVAFLAIAVQWVPLTGLGL